MNQGKTMKAKLMTMAVAAAVAAGGMSTAHAGHRDAAWAAVGGLVVGAVAGAAMASSAERTTVVYSVAPPPAPVVYAPAPVVYAPAPVVVHRPHRPVCAPPRVVYAPAPVVVSAPPVCVLPPPPVVVHHGRSGRHCRPSGPHFRVSVGW